MKTISEIDTNFKIDTKIEKEGIRFFDCLDKMFKLYGVFFENGKFRRMPENVAKSVSEGVYLLHTNTAGGRVRFRTDSKYVAVSAVIPSYGERMPHITFCGSSGFDLYVGTEYEGTFMPPWTTVDSYESIIEFKTAEMRDITINFPLYNDVEKLYIGLDKNASVEEAEPYKYDTPVVYYGSSITQGGCASRAGTSYQGFISRRFNCDYVNLGFSGNAKAEDEIADYIKNLDMKLFVYDYDHNAPSAEHLEKTHARMFQTIRKANPTLPIIMMARPKFEPDENEMIRKEIVKKTYTDAVAAGDKNVYYIDGKELVSYCGNEGTVDRVHPTDFGFASMAKILGDFIEKNRLL